jgi:tRNA pseudouridine55 synthase
MSKRERQTENRYTEGQVLLVDKPLGWTSFDVVKKIRWLTRAKAGHAGTLDPLATGLLICCTGSYTKKISDYQRQEKEYTGSLVLGARTPTYDLESEPQDFRDVPAFSPEDLSAVASRFTGDILQTPPAHAAIKKDGKPVYHLARKGIAVELEPRPVTIREFEITAAELPRVDFRVVCSTGTYIRSLARDFGEAAGCGAYLSALCRTRIGAFVLRDALGMEALEKQITENLRKDSPQPG